LFVGGGNTNTAGFRETFRALQCLRHRRRYRRHLNDITDIDADKFNLTTFRDIGFRLCGALNIDSATPRRQHLRIQLRRDRRYS
jgi:hypothetical protein